MNVKAKNVEPYLRLIGLGDLEKPMGVGAFLLASIYADELEQTIDKIEDVRLDQWFQTYIVPPTTHRLFYDGLTTLTSLHELPMVAVRANQILNLIPKPE